MTRSLGEKLRRRDWPAIAAELFRLESDRKVVDWDELRSDPEVTLANHGEVTVEYRTEPNPDCPVDGLYRPVPGSRAIIFIHPALTAERDAFTLLHEYGHHVQRQHPAWVDELYSLPISQIRRVEEHIADAFAAAVLIPDPLPWGERYLNPRVLRDTHASLGVSRTAIVRRAIDDAPRDSDCTVLVCDERGTVLTSRSVDGTVFAPRRGLSQRHLAEWFERAAQADGQASGMLAAGVEATSGWVQRELLIDLCLDATGRYAFVVLRPEARFGAVPVWEMSECECGRSSCGSSFSAADSPGRCEQCDVFRCPDCNGCACEKPANDVCGSCFMEYSLAEQMDPRLHVC